MDGIVGRRNLLYADFHRQMADLIARDQQAGHIPAALDPHAAALALVALAEGLAAYAIGRARRCWPQCDSARRLSALPDRVRLLHPLTRARVFNRVRD